MFPKKGNGACVERKFYKEWLREVNFGGKETQWGPHCSVKLPDRRGEQGDTPQSSKQ